MYRSVICHYDFFILKLLSFIYKIIPMEHELCSMQTTYIVFVELNWKDST